MRYCSVSDVKGWLNMTPTEIQYDTEIQQIILNVESQMDEQLRAYTTTPLHSTGSGTY
ncbi:MAG: hypothetical protein QXW32_04560 [Nitrososphaerales archaeon]